MAFVSVFGSSAELVAAERRAELALTGAPAVERTVTRTTPISSGSLERGACWLQYDLGL